MFAATRRWFRRHRTPIAVGLGVVGAGYVATQYVLNKLNDARERMSSDRIAKENLRRRFQQNQEDCTYTVLALLPTAATKIMETLDVEKLTWEIQQMKGGSSGSSNRGAKSDSMSLPETTTGFTDEDGQSMVSMSESGVHASQTSIPEPPDHQLATPTQPPEKAKRTKRQLWGDVTISSVTRAFTFLYTLALLTMLTRIQLNLLGRRSYLSSVVSLATGSPTGAISLENKDDDNATEAYGDDFEVNRKYLTFSWWLLNKGWVDVMQRVEAAVRQVFGQLSPRDQLTYETFCNLTAQVRQLVEGGGASSSSSPPPPAGQAVPNQTGATGARWLTFLLPPLDMEDYVLRESGILDDSATFATQQTPAATTNTTTETSAAAASLRRLLDETSDLIETPTFTHVLTQILDAGFSTLLDTKLAPVAFDMDPPTAASSSSRPPSQSLSSADHPLRTDTSLLPRPAKKVLLPKCLSILTRQAHAMGDAMPTNEYLAAMEKVRDLEGFAAVVYSSNWENEMREEGMMPPASHSSEEEGSASGRHHNQHHHQHHQHAGGTAAAHKEASSGGATQREGGVEESIVLVEDPSQSGSFESVWAKVTEK